MRVRSTFGIGPPVVAVGAGLRLTAVGLALALAGTALAGCGGDSRSGDASSAAATKAAPRPASRVAHWPRKHRRDGTRTVAILLSGAPAASSPRPTLSPHVAGGWTTKGHTEVFRPVSTLAPCTTYRITVPAGTTVAGGRPLGRRRSHEIRVPCPSTRATQDALARLHYLPYRVRARSGSTTRAPTHGRETRRQAAEAAFRPRARLEHRYSGAPKIHRGSLDPATKGALMGFQKDHDLKVDGLPGKTVWASLLAAEAKDRRDHHAYTWITVSKGGSETLTLHRAGHSVLSSPANTGVAGAETPDGTFPIFEHLPVTEMVGTNADGSTYDDPGVKYVSYFNGGDAVHAFERGSYGTPQSNGCVEIPSGPAAEVFGKVDIGDLVVVSG